LAAWAAGGVASPALFGAALGLGLVAAAAFGLPPEKVKVVAADTSTGPYAGASGGSKVTYTVGMAVERAAEAAREKLLAAASEELEIAPGDLEVVDGVGRAVGAPDRSISVEELATKTLRYGGRYEPIEGHGGSAQTSLAPSVSSHIAHVRVDGETGEVELLGYAIVQDLGRALNPALVEAEHEGALESKPVEHRRELVVAPDHAVDVVPEVRVDVEEVRVLRELAAELLLPGRDDRSGTLERCHERSAFQTRGGVIGSSVMRLPVAAATAFATAAGAPTTGASPIPFAPNGPSGAGTSTMRVSISGTRSAVGIA
jgi:hypothetical protein